MIEYNEKKAVQTEEPDIKPTKLFRRYRPKYLKKPEKRKSLRALTCFALVFAALMTSAVGTYAKYISPPVEIPSLSIQAAQFACKVEDFDFSSINKSEYGLNETDIIVGAFDVSNFQDSKISDVDLSIDVELYLGAKNAYNYTMVTEIDGSSGKVTNTLSDNYANTEEDVAKNIVYCNGLKDKSKHLKLIIGDYKEGAFTDTHVIEGDAVAPSSASNNNGDKPMSDATRYENNLSIDIDYQQLWKNAFQIKTGESTTKRCLIVIDSVVNDDNGNPITFKAPDINLSGTKLGTDNNLTVTVNQAKASA